MPFWVLKTYPEVCDSDQLGRSRVEKYFTPFNFEKKLSSTLGIGQVNFLVTLFKVW